MIVDLPQLVADPGTTQISNVQQRVRLTAIQWKEPVLHCLKFTNDLRYIFGALWNASRPFFGERISRKHVGGVIRSLRVQFRTGYVTPLDSAIHDFQMNI